MNFQPELAQAVMGGGKTVTRRLCSENLRSPWSAWGCGLKVGSDYAVCPGRGKTAIGRVRVTSVRREALGRLSAEEARREGFFSVQSFEQAWATINGSYDPDVQVWRVEFEVVEPDADRAGRRAVAEVLEWTA